MVSASWTRHAAMLFAALCFPAAAWVSPLKTDEEVVVFPTAAHLAEDGTHWVVPIHAWVFEPERESVLQKSLLAAAAASLGLGPGTAESEIFRERAAWFLVDNERGKRLDLTLTPDAHGLGPSGADGHLYAEVTLERRGDEAEPAPFWLSYAGRVELEGAQQPCFRADSRFGRGSCRGPILKTA